MRFFTVLLIVMVVGMLAIAGCTAPEPTAPTTPTQPTEPTTPTTPTTPTQPTEPTKEVLTASDIPELQALVDRGGLRGDLPINPYEDLLLKPDGTPFKFSASFPFFGSDLPVQRDGYINVKVTDGGGDYVGFSCDLDVQKEIGFVDDQISVRKPDAYLYNATDEVLAVGAADRLDAAGIPVFGMDHHIPTDTIICSCYTDFAQEPYGDSQFGKLLVEWAEATGEHVYLYELWGQHSMLTMLERDRALKAGLADSPLVTVYESGDTNWAAGTIASFITTQFTAHPEMNALFIPGPAGGGLAALEDLNRLYEVGDPNHVLFCADDPDAQIVTALEDNYIDWVGTHNPWLDADCPLKAAINYVVLGQSVPKTVIHPVEIMTPETVYTMQQGGGPAVWSYMPTSRWDIWPVLDTTEWGLPTPTMASRQQLKGY